MKYSLIALALTFYVLESLADETLSVPTDPQALYYVLEKGDQGAERFISYKRVGSSGTSYGKRLYNCSEHTVKYLGYGDTPEEMANSKPDANMTPIVPRSIAYHLGIAACK